MSGSRVSDQVVQEIITQGSCELQEARHRVEMLFHCVEVNSGSNR